LIKIITANCKERIMSKNSYVRGFVKVAAEHGVDPVQLIKVALSDGAKDALNFAGGAVFGGASGTLASPLTGFAGWNLGKKLKQKADIMEREVFGRLKSTDPQYKALYRKHGPAMDAAAGASGRLDNLMSDLELANEKRNLIGLEKVLTTKKEKLLHPLRYGRLVYEGNKADAEIQRLQDAGSKLRAEINAHKESARPLMDRSSVLRRMAGKKIGPRMVRAGGRLAPWIGLLMPPIVMGGLTGSGMVHDARKQRGLKSK
jgi:hypothetical protein